MTISIFKEAFLLHTASVCKMLLDAEGFKDDIALQFHYDAVAMSFLVVLALILMHRNVWAAVSLLAVGVCGMCILSDVDAPLTLFGMCCALLCNIAVIVGRTYLETSAFLNLYVQPSFLVLLSAVALFRCFRLHRYVVLSSVNLVLCSSILLWSCLHYGQYDLLPAAQLCFHDLMYISGNNYNVYVFWNIVIFIVSFLLLCTPSLIFLRIRKL